MYRHFIHVKQKKLYKTLLRLGKALESMRQVSSFEESAQVLWNVCLSGPGLETTPQHAIEFIASFAYS